MGYPRVPKKPGPEIIKRGGSSIYQGGPKFFSNIFIFGVMWSLDPHGPCLAIPLFLLIKQFLKYYSNFIFNRGIFRDDICKQYTTLSVRFLSFCAGMILEEFLTSNSSKIIVRKILLI